MFKIILILWLSLAAMVSAASAEQGQVPGQGEIPGGLNEVEKRAADLIRDPLILEAWNIIYHSDVAFDLEAGRTMTAKDLASYPVLDGIPVEWGSDSICNGSSCSLLFCDGQGNCVFEDGKPGRDPIYLNASIRNQRNGQMSRLVDDLAHEIFHRMQPFGPVTSTQLEEFLAFKVGALISKQEWPSFEGVDPLDPSQLEHWFYVHSMVRYLHLEAYPDDSQPKGIQPTIVKNSSKHGQEATKR